VGQPLLAKAFPSAACCKKSNKFHCSLSTAAKKPHLMQWLLWLEVHYHQLPSMYVSSPHISKNDGKNTNKLDWLFHCLNGEVSKIHLLMEHDFYHPYSNKLNNIGSPKNEMAVKIKTPIAVVTYQCTPFSKLHCKSSFLPELYSAQAPYTGAILMLE
jgi:hypothetical protein